MNITTPIDDQDARAAALGDDTHLVDDGLPALAVDVSNGLVVAANHAAVKLLGLGGGGAGKLDRAMPAWAAINAHVARQLLVPSRPEPLLFWTPSGPRTLTGVLATVASETRTLVRITLHDDQPTAAGANAAVPTVATTDAQASDLATLREIARRIRAGTAAMSGPPPASAIAEPLASPKPKTPPPLDFRPMQPDPVAATSGQTADPYGTDIAKLAHELRTPLSAIVSLAEIMRDERLGAMGNPRYKAYAADIHDSARHTLDLVGAMLDGDHGTGSGSSIEAKPKFKLDTVDLGDIAARCVSAMTPIASRGSVMLEVTPTAGLPQLLADRRALRQIILNVLSNALRFTPKNGRVTLATARAADGGLELSVTDTGTGMRPADIDRALGKASPEAPPRRIRIAGERFGFGFGLPLVRELAQAHGGRLAIDSKIGHGTRVTVTFPADHVV